MMKKIVHFFFIVTGGTIGFLYGPDIIKLLNITGAKWLESPYLGSILGAIILFVISYLLVDYIVGFLKWIEDGLIRLPIGDLFFRSEGHTSELQSRGHLVCRLLLEKKKYMLSSLPRDKCKSQLVMTGLPEQKVTVDIPAHIKPYTKGLLSRSPHIRNALIKLLVDYI